jgi:hypothetical protein
MKRICFLLLTAFVLLFSGFADDTEGAGDSEKINFSVSVFNYLDTQNDDAPYNNELRATGALDSAYFDFYADASLKNDGRYTSDEPDIMQGYYLFLNQGYLDINISDFNLKLGRAVHRDVIDSPYSLFISSRELPAMLADFSYEGDFFFYETRWVRLNTRSDALGEDGNTPSPGYTTFPDRGMNYKVYGIKAGDFRFGFQDAIVYSGYAFDEEYFFSPLPMYLTQLVTTSDGKPWSQEANTNTLLGLFADVDKDKLYAYGQVLFDDWNLLFFLPDSWNNPWKAAWALGGSYAFPFGKIGLHHSGATKYTFERTRSTEVGSKDWYEYAYYPSVVFDNDGDKVAIAYEDNYIGYKYGENTLAFLVDYENVMFKDSRFAFGLNAALEYVVSGSKSPSNEWHELDSHPSGSYLLDEDVLEHRFIASFALAKDLKDWTVGVRTRFGYVLNGLKVTGVSGDDDNDNSLYKPDPDNDFPFLDISFGVTYRFGF